MDHFMEEVVTKKNRAVDEIMYILSWGVLVLAGLFGLMEVSASLSMIASGNGVPWFDLVLGVLNVGVAVWVFIFHDRLRTEYEYTFTNGDLDFAMVFNNQKRKSLGSLKVRNVDAFGKVTSQSFQRYISMPGVKQRRWFLNRGAELYYFYFQKDDNKSVIVCEPSEELVQNIKMYLPHGAYQE